jgi:hypothetical protein
MLGIVNKITITQVSTAQHPGRTKKFEFSFLTDGNAQSTWAHLTDTMTIVMPRRLYFKDISTGKVTTWDKEPIYGNPNVQPLLLRGDAVSVEWGYSYFKPTQGSGFDRNVIVTQMAKRFDGFITRIKNKTPFEIECRDNMYKLQQTPVEAKQWVIDGKTYTLETAIKEMMSKSTEPGVKDFILKTDNIKHNIGKVTWYNFTVAQVLDDLRKTYHLESFFRGNELRVGVIRYYPQDRIEHEFNFQKNIASDDLDYQRADDVRIGIIAKSINKIKLVSLNSSGKQKTKHKQLKVTVGDSDGELRTMFFWGVQTETELKKLAEKKLPFIKYEGFRGSFTTFGLPFVKHGDSVKLVDEVLPERNGIYLVKAVEQLTNSGIGLKQKITLDIRIDSLTTNQISDFQENGI